MIRKFLQCSTTRERINLLCSTVLKDWSDQDLDYVLDALDLGRKENETQIDKVARIEKYLADYKHEVEQKNALDCKDMDSVPRKDAGMTLFGEKGIGDVMVRAKKQEEKEKENQK